MQACPPHTQRHSLPAPSTIRPPISSPPHSSSLTFFHCHTLYSMHFFAFSVFVSLSLCLTHCQQVLKPTASQPCAFSTFLCHFVFLSFLLASTHPFFLSPCLYTFSIILGCTGHHTIRWCGCANPHYLSHSFLFCTPLSLLLVLLFVPLQAYLFVVFISYSICPILSLIISHFLQTWFHLIAIL